MLLRALGSELTPQRLIAGTRQNLQAEVAAGRFSLALFYRLNVVHLVIPPLRDHREDIPVFLCRLVANHATEPTLEPPAASQVMAYDWPGNLGELEAVAHALLAHGVTSKITTTDVDRALRRTS